MAFPLRVAIRDLTIEFIGFGGLEAYLGIQKPTVLRVLSSKLRDHNLLFCRFWGYR